MVLPGLALLLAIGAGYLKWSTATIAPAETSGQAALATAKDSTVAMLSYRPDSAQRDLEAAQRRLTGSFADAYRSLIHDVVIPGARQKGIAAVASVPAAAIVTNNENHAVVLVMVDQTVTIGSEPPTATASSVRVTLDKVGQQWLISRFDPV
ncbi:MAG: hypothetical protein ACRDTS_10350 [Mycobacterium sp.]